MKRTKQTTKPAIYFHNLLTFSLWLIYNGLSEEWVKEAWNKPKEKRKKKWKEMVEKDPDFEWVFLVWFLLILNEKNTHSFVFLSFKLKGNTLLFFNLLFLVFLFSFPLSFSCFSLQKDKVKGTKEQRRLWREWWILDLLCVFVVGCCLRLILAYTSFHWN